MSDTISISQGIAEGLAQAAKAQYAELRKKRITADFEGSEEAYQAFLDQHIDADCVDKWTHEYFFLVARDLKDNPPATQIDPNLEKFMWF